MADVHSTCLVDSHRHPLEAVHSRSGRDHSEVVADVVGLAEGILQPSSADRLGADDSKQQAVAALAAMAAERRLRQEVCRPWST